MIVACVISFNPLLSMIIYVFIKCMAASFPFDFRWCYYIMKFHWREVISLIQWQISDTLFFTLLIMLSYLRSLESEFSHFNVCLTSFIFNSFSHNVMVQHSFICIMYIAWHLASLFYNLYYYLP